MPYELTFRKKLEIADRDRYFNDECIGGDVVADRLLPEIRARYQDVQSNQEDWGWFIWCSDGPVSLAIDIYCDDVEAGAFRIDLTSRVKRFLLGPRNQDTPELEKLKALVLDTLSPWAESSLEVKHRERT